MNTTNQPRSRRSALLPVLLLCVSSACQKPAEEPVPTALEVENEALNLLFTDAPEGLELLTNDDSRVELAPAAPAPGGEAPADPGRRLWVTADEVSEFGIQLVDLVNSQRAEFEAMQGGSYSGAREIQIPLAGQAYYVRGQYDFEGTRVEEVRVFLVHPAQNRLVTFHSRYASDTPDLSATRIQELLDWVAEMEPLRSYEQLQAAGEASAE